MKLLFQKSLHSSAQILENGKIEAKAVLLSTDIEMAARIVAAHDSFLIEQAEWESLRSGSHYVSDAGEAAALVGAQAYFGVASSLARAFPGEDSGPQRALFAECIKAVIQSECYLYPQRGFPDPQAYQADWDAAHPNSCRYYSHLDIVLRRWFSYIGDEARTGSLFHRHKNIAVWRSDSGGLQATGSFLDSFHELGIHAECAADGKIIAFNGCFLRAPDSICFGTAAILAGLCGRNIHEISRKDLNRLLGGSEGCAHLLDLGQELLTDLHKISQFV
jgi:hypothetical protein